MTSRDLTKLAESHGGRIPSSKAGEALKALYRKPVTTERFKATRDKMRSEQDIQIEIAEWCRDALQIPPLGPWWTAINPIPGKSKAAAGLSKAMGMKAGAPDLIFLWRGLLIGVELKSASGTISGAQEICRHEIDAAKGDYQIARSLAELKSILDAYFIPYRDDKEVAFLRVKSGRHPRKRAA